MRICSVPRCLRPHHARGWCGRHYQRWLRTIGPLGVKTPSPPGDNLVHRFDEVHWRPCGGHVAPFPPHRCDRCGLASDSIALVPADWRPGVRMT